MICDGKSLVQAVSNVNSADTYAIQQQTSAAVLAMSKSILIVWARDHCCLSGNELSDHQAILDAAETQPDNALEPATRRALSRRSSRPPPIQHERLKEVCTSLPDEQTESTIVKTKRTDLARFRNGHHPALRRWQHFVGISEDAVCRLCGEEV